MSTDSANATSDEAASPATAPPTAALNLLFAVEDCVRLGGFSLSLLLISNLLRAHFASRPRHASSRRAVHKFSAPMTTYFLTNALFLSASMFGGVCVAYKRVRALPNTFKYDLLLYWTETFNVHYSAAAGIPVFFMTLDRCLAIAYPILYLHSTLQKRLNAVGIAVVALVYCSSALLLVLETPIPEERFTNCTSFPCLTPKFRLLPQNLTIFSFGILNIVCSIYFLSLERAFSTGTNIANRVVKVTVIAEFAFVTMPTTLNMASKILFRQTHAAYIGSLFAALFALNIAFCSVLYTVILFRRPAHFLQRSKVGATQIKSFSTPTN